MTQADNIALLNSVLNAPEVLMATAPGYISLDAANFFTNPLNLMVGTPKGVVLFYWKAPGLYEGHQLFTHQMRGREALLFIKDAIAQLFTLRDAYAIVGTTLRENRAARAMNRAFGGRPTGVGVNALGQECIHYILEREAWSRQSRRLSA